MNFYLCKVGIFVRQSDGFTRFMAKADLPDVVNWDIYYDGNMIKTITEQVRRYPGISMERVYDVSSPSIETPPTMVLIRTENTLDPSDYDWDMTTRNSAAWQQMYATYQGMRDHPYTDAPFQPA